MKGINSCREESITAGGFFMTTTILVIIALNAANIIVKNADLLFAAAATSERVDWTPALELILAIVNIGTGLILVPLLRRLSGSWGLVYACYKLLEAAFIAVGIFSLLCVDLRMFTISF